MLFKIIGIYFCADKKKMASFCVQQQDRLEIQLRKNGLGSGRDSSTHQAKTMDPAKPHA